VIITVDTMKYTNAKDICWPCKGTGKTMGSGMMLRTCKNCCGSGKAQKTEEVGEPPKITPFEDKKSSSAPKNHAKTPNWRRTNKKTS